MSVPIFRKKFFNECYGTFKAEIGLFSDEVRVTIVHGEEGYPNLEHRIFSALAKKASLAYVGHSIIDGCHRFILDRKAAGFETVNSRWRFQEIWGPKINGPATIQCAIEIFSLTPAQFRHFRDESECVFRRRKPTDFSISPLDRQTHRAMSAYHFTMTFRDPHFFGTIFFHKHIVILLRLMARSRGIEGSASRGYLSPLVLYFFTRRYILELASIEHAAHLDENLDKVPWLEQAKYVCERISTFDYLNYKWSETEDVRCRGETLRVCHPVYQECVTENLTPENTRNLMRIFAGAARAHTIEEFLKGGKRSAEGELEVTGMERDGKRSCQ
jgi:hypothetical protein